MPERMTGQFSVLCSIVWLVAVATFAALSSQQLVADEVAVQDRLHQIFVWASLLVALLVFWALQS